MGLEEFWPELINKLDVTLLVSKSQVLVAHADAEKVFDFLRSERKTIQGFEGFSIEGQEVRAIVDCVADFTIDGETKVESGTAQRILESEAFSQADWIEFVLAPED